MQAVADSLSLRLSIQLGLSCWFIGSAGVAAHIAIFLGQLSFGSVHESFSPALPHALHGSPVEAYENDGKNAEIMRVFADTKRDIANWPATIGNCGLNDLHYKVVGLIYSQSSSSTGL